MAQKTSEAEAEVVLLKAVKELVDSIVNFEVLNLTGSDPESEIRFHTITHQKFFNLVLVDFLSVTDKRAPIGQTTYLNGLRTIAERPQFNVEDSVLSLRTATAEFVNWLEQEIEAPTWFPSINVQATLILRRLDFLKISGNICKHNFLRSLGFADDVRAIFERSGHVVTLEEALLALADFYERFHTDIFNYHSSTIAEFLNNIRWGLYEYLQPEFQRSFVWDRENPPMYRYTYPPSITTAFSRDCYWGLMNEVRSPPYMRKFRVTRWLKLRY